MNFLHRVNRWLKTTGNHLSAANWLSNINRLQVSRCSVDNMHCCHNCKTSHCQNYLMQKKWCLCCEVKWWCAGICCGHLRGICRQKKRTCHIVFVGVVVVVVGLSTAAIHAVCGWHCMLWLLMHTSAKLTVSKWLQCVQMNIFINVCAINIVHTVFLLIIMNLSDSDYVVMY